MNVLIVEDDPNLRALWRAVLGGMSYLVHEAETLAAAKTALRSTHFDLVLLDLYLGPDTSLSLISQAGTINPDCKVVIVTGSAIYPKAELFAVSDAVSSILRKPVDVEDLIAICKNLAPSRSASAKSG